jgi:carboxymethylenebutenolidase
MAYRSQTLDVQGSPMETLVFVPEASGPHPGLVIAQHLPVAHAGLEKDPFTLDLGERYAAAGYVCVIPFVFHWWPADDEMMTKAKAFRDDWTLADLAAAYAFLAGLDQVDPDRVGILGHCWGGRIAWLGACANPQYKACVVFYGGRIKISLADRATPPIEQAQGMQCPLLGIFGNEDQNPSPADVDDYQAALQAAGISCEFHRYDGAGHGFQDFHNVERFRQAQSEDAWDKALTFLERNLKV